MDALKKIRHVAVFYISILADRRVGDSVTRDVESYVSVHVKNHGNVAC